MRMRQGDVGARVTTRAETAYGSGVVPRGRGTRGSSGSGGVMRDRLGVGGGGR